MRHILHSIVLVLLVSACADDGTPPVDDGAPVQKVDCSSASPVATVTAPGNRYAPDVVMLQAGDVVRFEMPGAHDAVSDDRLFDVGFGATECLRFNDPGTYGFFCKPHGFRGSIVAQ